MVDDLTGLGKALEPFSKSVEVIVTEFTRLLGLFMEPIAKGAGELIREEFEVFALRRKSRVVKIMQKAKKQLDDSSLQPQPVLDKILVPIIEGASLEDDEDLTIKWVGLLASAAAGDRVHASYPKILADLTPEEARMLDTMYERYREHHIDAGTLGPWAALEGEHLYRIDEIKNKVAINEDQLHIALTNLARLGLCDIQPFNTTLTAELEVSNEHNIRFSPLGYDFVKTCRGPSRKPSMLG